MESSILVNDIGTGYLIEFIIVFLILIALWPLNLTQLIISHVRLKALLEVARRKGLAADTVYVGNFGRVPQLMRTCCAICTPLLGVRFILLFSINDVTFFIVSLSNDICSLVLVLITLTMIFNLAKAVYATRMRKPSPLFSVFFAISVFILVGAVVTQTIVARAKHEAKYLSIFITSIFVLQILWLLSMWYWFYEMTANLAIDLSQDVRMLRFRRLLLLGTVAIACAVPFQVITINSSVHDESSYPRPDIFTNAHAYEATSGTLVAVRFALIFIFTWFSWTPVFMTREEEQLDQAKKIVEIEYELSSITRVTGQEDGERISEVTMSPLGPSSSTDSLRAESSNS